jgi:hypothetical protein
MVHDLRRVVFAALLVILATASLASPYPVLAKTQRKALVLSSIEHYARNAYDNTIQGYIQSAGYTVTHLNDQEVTLNVLTKHLNEYDLVVWRTDVYERDHIIYWYVGEFANAATRQAYASDFKAGWIDDRNGIIGVSIDFFWNHFNAGSLGHIRLAILVFSFSAGVASILLRAGVKSIVDYFGAVSFSFSDTDYVTALIFRCLSTGENVEDAVAGIIEAFSSMTPRDPLDSISTPPLFWMGDGTMTLT